MAAAVAARMLAEAMRGTRHSARLPPHVPFTHYETSPRKLFNVRKKRKGQGKKPKKPIKVAPDDDDYLDFPFSSVASRSDCSLLVNEDPDNATVAQAILSTAFTQPTRDPDRSRRILQNNLAGVEAMQKHDLLFKEAWRLNPYDRRLSRNNLGQDIDKGKTKNLRIPMKPKSRRRVRARSQSVIAMQLGMLGPHFPPTPVSSRQDMPDLTAGPPTRENTPAPSLMSGPLMPPGWKAPTPVPTRQNTPHFEDSPVAGPSRHPGALEWKELTPVPTRPNTPQFDPGASAPLGSQANPFRLDMIEEEPMDVDMEFDPSK
ncbi:hypothetical protein EDD18DRAFT_1354249 [Armillaria luteobubalina]|uniref:Uncharacterized protein n=1 Tax=Armillaria luteobubalina TaxID=153913 RepID=A0AA39UNL4_9AGAR|nr:hypothetical protein EDD18DRAFT_1354249 [Armillaria luteobubalina]